MNNLIRRVLQALITGLVLLNIAAVLFLTTTNQLAFNLQMYDTPMSGGGTGSVVSGGGGLRHVGGGQQQRILQSHRQQQQAFPPPMPTHNATQDFLIEMEARRATVEGVCHLVEGAAARRAANNVSYSELYLQRQDKLLWCPVYKASSSNWLSYFVKLARATKAVKELESRRHGGRINEVANVFYPKINTKAELDAFDSAPAPPGKANHFVIVRHPFYRLVSAYRDKLERTLAARYVNDYYYNLYGRKIVQRHRKGALRRFGNEFFDAKNNFGSPLPVRKRGRRVLELPTFWEFVQFVKETPIHLLDIHWRPASVFCSPCHIRYDYILRFEDLSEEEELFKKVVGLEKRLGGAGASEKRNVNRPTGMSDHEVTELYFKQIDEEDILALYRIYEDDFKMFGYRYESGDFRFPLWP